MTTALPRRQLLIVALAGISLLLAASGWLLLVAPQRQHASSAASQVQQTQNELAQLKAAANAPTHPKQPQIRTKALYALETAMPLTENQPDLLLGLDQLATSFGVQVTSLSPGTPSLGAGYTIQPVSLGLSGTYFPLTHFLHRLRTLVAVRHQQVVASGRLFAVTLVSLSREGKGNTLTATVALQAFVYGAVAGATQSSTTTGSTSTDSTTTGG